MYRSTCFFLDVGQGSAHFLNLGNGRAIIIDTGSNISPKQLVLDTITDDKNIQSIEALILTHSDEDHIGNAATYIYNHIDIIKKIYLVHDSLNETEVVKNFWRTMRRLFKRKNGDYYRQKFIPFHAPQVLFNEIIDDTSVKLDLLYPTYSHALDAELSNTPNNASAILLFTVGEKKILFTGDAPYSAFKWVYNKYGKISTDIITVPHHGGEIDATPEQLNLLYSDFIPTSKAIISVGRNNKYNHPLQSVIQSLVQNNIEIFCTQLSNNCCPDCYIEQWQEKRGYVGLKHAHSSLNPSTFNIPCMGTIQVNISSDNLTIENIEQLQANRKTLAEITSQNPVCLYT